MRRFLKAAVPFAGIFVFLLSIELLSHSMKILGKPFAEKLLTITFNPVVGLFIGILVTTLVQSSSVTTSLTVGLVAGGAIPIKHAIPIIMGANIGTTVTNLLVALFHITRKREFEKAMPAAIVHDFFNVLSVLIFFPLEVIFHPIEIFSNFLTHLFSTVGGLHIVSPLKIIFKPLVKAIGIICAEEAWIMIPIAVVLLYGSLKVIVDSTRKLVSARFEILLDKYLFGNPAKAFLIGILFTATIQSSSVTTSLVVPLAAAGLLTVEKIYPYTLGANIGTTITAILASLITQNPYALQAAFSHLVFNIFGTVVWYPGRRLPIYFAKVFGNVIAKKRYIAIIYPLLIFVVLPLLFIIFVRR